MDEATVEALRGAVEHWRRLHELKPNENSGAGQCPLCQRFRRCVKCPVHLTTSLMFCEGTPYEAADEVFDELELEQVDENQGLIAPRKDQPRDKLAQWDEAVCAELDFLIGLLPEPFQALERAKEAARRAALYEKDKAE